MNKLTFDIIVAYSNFSKDIRLIDEIESDFKEGPSLWECLQYDDFIDNTEQTKGYDLLPGLYKCKIHFTYTKSQGLEYTEYDEEMTLTDFVPIWFN